jgi:hypothetical protein
MKFKNLLLLSSLILLLVCCRQEDVVPQQNPYPTGNCDPRTYNEIDKSLMQQFLFKPGTYWIYKDSVNNTTDSCFSYGTKINSGMQQTSGGMGVGPCYTKYRYAIDSTNLLDSSRYNYYIMDKDIRLIAPFGFASVFLCSNSSGNLTGDSLSVFYPTITINGSAYSNVYKFHFKTMYGKYREGYHYMKPGVGIIKLELYTTDTPAVRKVYELERYHIE